MSDKKAFDVPFLGSDGGLRRNFSMARFLSRRWKNTAMSFGLMGLVGFLYVTDWKVIVNKIPFYRNQFKEEEEE